MYNIIRYRRTGETHFLLKRRQPYYIIVYRGMYRWTQTWNTFITAIHIIIIFRYDANMRLTSPWNQFQSQNNISCQIFIQYGSIDLQKARTGSVFDWLYSLFTRAEFIIIIIICYQAVIHNISMAFYIRNHVRS